MPPRKAARKDAHLEPLDEIARLLVMQLRSQFDTQAQLVTELGKAGFSAPRIADLVGTSSATVRTDLKRSRTAKARKRKTGTATSGGQS